MGDTRHYLTSDPWGIIVATPFAVWNELNIYLVSRTCREESGKKQTLETHFAIGKSQVKKMLQILQVRLLVFTCIVRACNARSCHSPFRVFRTGSSPAETNSFSRQSSDRWSGCPSGRNNHRNNRWKITFDQRRVHSDKLHSTFHYTFLIFPCLKWKIDEFGW